MVHVQSPPVDAISLRSRARLGLLVPIIGILLIYSVRTGMKNVLSAPEPLARIVSALPKAPPAEHALLSPRFRVATSFFVSGLCIALAFLLFVCWAPRVFRDLGRCGPWLWLFVPIALFAFAQSVGQFAPAWLWDLGVVRALTIQFPSQAGSLDAWDSLFDGFFFLVNWAIVALLYALTIRSLRRATPNAENPMSEEQRVRVLAMDFRCYNLIVYVASALLIAAVVRSAVCTSWFAPFLEKSGAESISALARSALAFDGITATFLLLTVLGPVAVVLSEEAMEIARSAAPGVATERRWLADRGFPTSFADWLPRIGAILGPAVTGSFFGAPLG